MTRATNRARVSMMVGLALALALTLGTTTPVQAKEVGRSAQIGQQARKSFYSARRALVSFGLKARAAMGLEARGGAKVLTNAWSMKNGVKVQHYELLGSRGEKVGYQRVVDGKPGRRTMVGQDLSRGIQKERRKEWTGRNDTRFSAATTTLTSGTTLKARGAAGKNGGLTRTVASSSGWQSKRKRWQAKSTMFEHRSFQTADGRRYHSRRGFPVQIAR